MGKGQRIRKIQVFVGGWQIKAIRLWLTGDGDFQEFGSPQGCPSREFTFDDNERVTSMSLWGNGAGTRAGAIKFRTSADREFDYGMTDWGRKREYRIDVGSGILVGAVYDSGFDIDAQGYWFLSSSILNTNLSSLRYGHLRGNSEIETLDSYRQTNRSSTRISWTFSGEKEVTMSKKWTSSKENVFNVNAIAKAEVPFFNVHASFEWHARETSSDERFSEERRKLSWSNGGQLSPGQSISLTVITHKGTLHVPYTGTVTINLANGAKFTYEETGTFTGIGYSSVEIRNIE
ncbi:hypothetical protein KP509_02G024800 [Ceratopteris richardii]|uniref:Jacalin-type lectin domain-containing protein n=1 Tax=Ceratopteris richardii TaxID=49495 RepID=A0A8T2V7J6_CERRI|nr:hypothetical protein KP509_02G024800 [Ceratopteris richardii]